MLGTTNIKNSWYILFFLDNYLLFWLDCSNPTRTTDSHLKRIICTNCCIHMVVPPDDGPRYARNMQRLTKYTKNKLCIKLVVLYTIAQRCTVNRTQKINLYVSAQQSRYQSFQWQHTTYIQCIQCIQCIHRQKGYSYKMQEQLVI